MFIISMWGVKGPTHYSRTVGHEVPGVVAVLCECMVGYREVIHLARDMESRLYITWHFFAKLDKINSYNYVQNCNSSLTGKHGSNESQWSVSLIHMCSSQQYKIGG